MEWSIAFAKVQLGSALSSFGHNLVVLKDPSGRVVSQINGGPSDGRGGHLSFSLQGKISVLVTDAGNPIGDYYHRMISVKEDKPIKTGTEQEVKDLWAVAVQAASAITAKNITYQPALTIPDFFGFGPLNGNSNSVADTIVKAMGLDSPADIDPSTWADPGSGNILLNKQEINKIRGQLNFNPITFNGDAILETIGDKMRWTKFDENERIDLEADYNLDGEFENVADWNPDGSRREYYFEDGPDAEFFIDIDAASNIQSLTRSGASMAAAEIGEFFGSYLGRAIGRGNTLAEIGAGTVLGLVMSKIGSAAEASIRGNLGVLGDGFDLQGEYRDAVGDLGNQLGGFGGDLAVRLAGVGSSLLVAEIADALGLQGFEGQVFSAVVNGVTSNVVKNAVSLALQGNLTADALMQGLTAGSMALNIANSLGGLFGAQLGARLITPESRDAALFASAASALGSLAGTLLLSSIPFIGPFIGAFLGQTLGTWAGNQIFVEKTQAGIYLVADPLTGYLTQAPGYVLGEANPQVAGAIGGAVTGTVNQLLAFTGGRIGPLDGPNVEVGYYVNSVKQQWAYGAGHQAFYANAHGDRDEAALSGVAQKTIDRVVSTMTLVGADPVMQRALDATRAKAGPEGELVELGFDLQTAKDYRTYLDNHRLINAVIAADPDGAFAAGWTVTLLRAQELGLHQASVHDMRGGIAAHIAHRGLASLSDALGYAPDADASGALLLADEATGGRVRLERVFGPGASVDARGTEGADMISTAFHGVQSPARAHGGAGADTIEGSAGVDLIDGGSGNDLLYGWNGHDWLHGGDGADTLDGGAGDDLLAGGRGDDLMTGGAGANTYHGGEGSDRIVISQGERRAEVIAPTAGGAFQWDSLHFAPGFNAAASVFRREGSDLTVLGRVGTWLDNWITVVEEETHQGPEGPYTVTVQKTVNRPVFDEAAGRGAEVVVRGFFLAAGSLDAIVFDDGAFQGADLQARLGPKAPGGGGAAVERRPDPAGERETVYDADGSQAWTTIERVRNAAGGLLSETNHLDNGQRVHATYGPGGSVTTVTDAAGRPLVRDEARPDGTSTHVEYDAARAEPWTSVAWERVGGQVREARTLMDDGRTVTAEYDLAGAPWTRILTERDAKGRVYGRVEERDDGSRVTHDYWRGDGSQAPRLASMVIAHAGGTRERYAYDPLGIEAWTYTITTTDASGRVFGSVEQRDDGTRVTSDYWRGDGTGAPRLASTVIAHAGGVTERYAYDPLGIEAWTYTITTTDASGRVFGSVEQRDDGTRVTLDYHRGDGVQAPKLASMLIAYASGVTERYAYDYTGTEAWTYTITTADPQGRTFGYVESRDEGTRVVSDYYRGDGVSAPRLASTVVAFADGRTERYAYDYTGTEAWTYTVTNTDAQGRVYGSLEARDDGTRVYLDYWRGDGNQAPKLASMLYAFGNGTSERYEYDHLGAYSWAYTVTNRDAQGRTFGLLEVLDNGTRVMWDYHRGDGSQAPKRSSVVYAYADGSGVRYDYDYLEAQAWSRTIRYTDELARTKSMTYDMDDGGHVVHIHDHLNQHPWSRTVTTYDAAWNPLQRQAYDDAGMLMAA